MWIGNCEALNCYWNRTVNAVVIAFSHLCKKIILILINSTYPHAFHWNNFCCESNIDLFLLPFPPTVHISRYWSESHHSSAGSTLLTPCDSWKADGILRMSHTFTLTSIQPSNKHLSNMPPTMIRDVPLILQFFFNIVRGGQTHVKKYRFRNDILT